MSSVAPTPESVAAAPVRVDRADVMALTKARLSALVAVTTAAGYYLGAGPRFSWWILLHTVFGTLLCAFGSAVFNQLMEIDPDARMARTADRPLPARRIPPAVAFIMGMLLSAWGLVHLNHQTNFEAAVLAALTLFTYLFLYTPLKQRSTLNTVVGAVAGALPPLIGWAAAAGPADHFRGHLLIQPQVLFLFGLLFLWQMPHFLAINWMYRDEYRRGGFVMWSNEDDTGAFTSTLTLVFTLALFPLMAQPWLSGFGGPVFTVLAFVATALWLWLALKFFRLRTRPAARQVFFASLAYLPLVLLLFPLLKRG